MRDMPSITSNNYGTSNTTYMEDALNLNSNTTITPYPHAFKLDEPKGVFTAAQNLQTVIEDVKKMPANPKRRLVQVLVVDPNENVPLDKCLLYKGDEKLTDLTDQELYFELDIKKILEDHNKYRVTVRDKAVKERDEFLEPVKIRELKMVVVNIAEF